MAKGSCYPYSRAASLAASSHMSSTTYYDFKLCLHPFLLQAKWSAPGHQAPPHASTLSSNAAQATHRLVWHALEATPTPRRSPSLPSHAAQPRMPAPARPVSCYQAHCCCTVPAGNPRRRRVMKAKEKGGAPQCLWGFLDSDEGHTGRGASRARCAVHTLQPLSIFPWSPTLLQPMCSAAVHASTLPRNAACQTTLRAASAQMASCARLTAQPAPQ